VGTGRHLRRRAVLALIAAILALAWPASMAGPALVVLRDVGSPDAVVMLASHEWERLPATAAAASRFPATMVLLTVPKVPTQHNCHLCGERAAWLRHAGVSAARIVELPHRVSNTYDEALAARAYASAHRIGRLSVVTSPYHARRALRVFEHVLGPSVQIGVLPASVSSPAEPARWWRHPYDRAYVFYEWAALLKYRVQYGVPLRSPR
jgi:uncharacterized SAM-binding protein YcdF (DUF218 family)